MQNTEKLSAGTMARLVGMQRNEETGALIYEAMAAKEKDEHNKKILLQMAADEKSHAAVWKDYTKQSVAPSKAKLLWLKIITVLLGFTFVLKTIQKDEAYSAGEYKSLSEEIPEAVGILKEEQAHENMLINMLDEERLQYVGSMVLGLNDALVELTGTIAGLSFALMNTRLVALSGIITGISATLSMAASNYLAEKAAGNENAFKSSLYTGIAYLVTVALLVLPFLAFGEAMYVPALVTMLVTVILIILFFNYYISVAKSLPFLRRFAEMAVISLSVAAVSFIIGILVKEFLGIDI